MLPDNERLWPTALGDAVSVAGGAAVGDVGADGELHGNLIFWNGGNSSFSSSTPRLRSSFSSTTAMVLRRVLLPPGRGPGSPLSIAVIVIALCPAGAVGTLESHIHGMVFQRQDLRQITTPARCEKCKGDVVGLGWMLISMWC